MFTVFTFSLDTFWLDNIGQDFFKFDRYKLKILRMLQIRTFASLKG